MPASSHPHGCDVEPLLLARAQQSVDTIALRGLHDLLRLLRHAVSCLPSPASLVTVSTGRGAGITHHNTPPAGPCIAYNAVLYLYCFFVFCIVQPWPLSILASWVIYKHAPPTFWRKRAVSVIRCIEKKAWPNKDSFLGLGGVSLCYAEPGTLSCTMFKKAHTVYLDVRHVSKLQAS